MPNSIITRSDITPLVPEDVIREIVQGAVENSAVLTMGKRLQDTILSWATNDPFGKRQAAR